MKAPWIAVLTLSVAACDTPTETDAFTHQASLAGHGAPTASTGGGYFAIGTLDVKFSYNAVQTSASGDAMGRASHSVQLGGELIEFETNVTCLTVDPVNSRAWIGGTITKNNSTHPSFTGAIHEPGQDIWFRVVDYGEGMNAPRDRSTFVGFEGGAGIITSHEYCDLQPWPAGDARTNPVTEGNLQVRG